MATENITICTIISKNYLAHARVLADSFLKNNPNGKIFVLLVDELENHFEPNNEKFSLISLDDIKIPNLESFCFKYSILEMNTNVKAHFLKYLFEKYQLKKLSYFDPDILFTNSLQNLWKLLDKKSIVLTPHITEPIFDEKKPSEHDILRSGIFNLGFIGLSDTKTTRKFLDWWGNHLLEHGYNNIEKGMFTDQKWIDLVPSIFEDVYIIRHSGYNIAYWNLMQRDVEIKDRRIYVGSKPAYFFHFSGFSPESIENVSKHQNRFSINDLENIKELFELYRDLLIENNYLKINKWKCKFNYFDNGVKIPQSARKIFSEIGKNTNFSNPFMTNQKNCFFNYLNEEIDNKKPPITRLMYSIFQERPDVKETFSDPLKTNRVEFIKWFKNSAQFEYNLDPKFCPIIDNDIKLQNLTSLEKTHVPLGSKKSNITQKFSPGKSDIGINVSGYFQGEFGIAEEARNFVKSVQSVNIPFCLNNIRADNHRWNDTSLKEFQDTNRFPINLVIVNADQVDVIYKNFGPSYFQNKFNIAAWAWELPDFPEKWSKNFQYFDEIWTLSSFMADSISKRSPIPVIKMTYPLEIDETKFIRNRSKFLIEQKSFVFLFIFDFYSVFYRKNPLGIIEAFKKAFSQEDGVYLIIKCINHSKFPSEYKKMLQQCNKKNIRILNEHLDKDEVLSLMASSDCYVSLHRSEGVGLTIAEVMLAGKPIIATGYGGNNDFMNLNNSFPVKYKIVELEKDYGPYTKGNVWAEPDIDHAASQMRYVFENQDFANKIGLKGSMDIRQKMNPKVTGMEILKRVQTIYNHGDLDVLNNIN